MSRLTDEQAERNRLMGRRRRKRNELRRLQGIPVSLVPADPVRDHLLALVDLGWQMPSITAASGVDVTPEGLWQIAYCQRAHVERKALGVLRMPLTVHVPDSIPDSGLVPALGAARRVGSLLAIGWRHEDITAAAGVNLASLLTGVAPKAVLARRWRAADRAFRHLSGRPGPSQIGARRARAIGHCPPLAWEDIDNPNERPKGVAA